MLDFIEACVTGSYTERAYHIVMPSLPTALFPCKELHAFHVVWPFQILSTRFVFSKANRVTCTFTCMCNVRVCNTHAHVRVNWYMHVRVMACTWLFLTAHVVMGHSII